MRCALSAVILLAGLSAASAADFPAEPAPRAAAVSPAYNWSGFYAGVNAGGGTASGNIAIPGLGSASGNGITGAIAGGQAGFNWQSGALVLGVESDYQWSGQAKSWAFGPFITERASIDSFGTLRARAGVAVDRVLVYGTAGAAYLTGRDRLTAAGAEIATLSTSGWGWTAGAGVEFAIFGGWTAKAEYLYLQSARTSTSIALPPLLGGGAIPATVTLHDHIGRVGVNYRF